MVRVKFYKMKSPNGTVAEGRFDESHACEARSELTSAGLPLHDALWLVNKWNRTGVLFKYWIEQV